MIKEGEMQMVQLIKVNIDTKTVSARELHEKLAIGTQYTKDQKEQREKDLLTMLNGLTKGKITLKLARPKFGQPSYFLFQTRQQQIMHL